MAKNLDIAVAALKEAGKLQEANELETYVNNLEKSYNTLEKDSKKAFEKRDAYKAELEVFKAKEQEAQLKDIPEDKKKEYKEFLDKGLKPEEAKKLLDIEVKENADSITGDVDKHLEDINKDKNEEGKETTPDTFETLSDAGIDFA